MIVSWYEFAELHGVSLKDCRLSKDDVSGAFTQFNIHSKSARLFGVEICGFIFIFIVGLFGWCGAPIVFALLSRAFQRLLTNRIPRGCFNLFVDDVISLSLVRDADAVQTEVHVWGDAMFGVGAMEITKKIPPSLRQVVIGWQVDLATELIRPSDRAINKLLFVFFSFDFDLPQQLKLCQAIASLAQRYSMCLEMMRVFVSPLHALAVKDNLHRNAKIRFSLSAKFCVVMWRLVAVMLYFERDCLSVHFSSLLPSVTASEFTLVSDAGPNGLGAAVYSQNGLLVAFASFVLPFSAIESDYQNIREYMGFMFALLLLRRVRPTFVSSYISRITWLSDNVSALAWVSKNMASSVGAQFSLLAVSWMKLKFKFEVVATSHIPGISMGAIDSLSRGLPHSLPLSFEITALREDIRVIQLFRWCDPTLKQNLSGHLDTFAKVHGLLSEL
jgi:hypothetical protein